MFSLNTQMVKVAGVDLRNEKKPDGEVESVCDISIVCEISNTVLVEFHPQLRSSFYQRDENVAQDMLDGIEHLSVLKFPTFPRFPWKGTLEGYTLIAHTGIDAKSEIKLIDSKINKVFFFMKEKGVVAMDFIVRAPTHPDDVAKLSTIFEKEVQITLVPPDEKKLFEIEQAKAKQRAKLDEHFTGGDDQTQKLPLSNEDEEPEVDGKQPAINVE